MKAFTHCSLFYPCFILLILSVCFPGSRLLAQEPSWETLFLRDAGGLYRASSELGRPEPGEGPGKYGPRLLFDGDMQTAWAEGAGGSGTGERIWWAAGSEAPASLILANGYQKSEYLFYANNRICSLKVTLYAGFIIPGEVTEAGTVVHVLPLNENFSIEPADKTGEQEMDLPFGRETLLQFAASARIRFMEEFGEEMALAAKYSAGENTSPLFSWIIELEITGIYPGKKWDDTCISELRARGETGMDTGVFAGENGDFIYVWKKQGVFILAGAAGIAAEMKLAEGEHLSLVLMELSPCGEWAWVDFMIGREGGGRTEEIPRLYHLPSLRCIDPEAYGNPFGLYGFEFREGKTWLLTGEGELDLEALRMRLNL